jgi:hypothetical protein
LEQNPDKICWDTLSLNPSAIPMLEGNLDKINWNWLSRNRNAIHLLKQNPERINWDSLSRNPSIFEYDYESMRGRMRPLAEELMANRFHPKNFEKFYTWGFDEFNLDL